MTPSPFCYPLCRHYHPGFLLLASGRSTDGRTTIVLFVFTLLYYCLSALFEDRRTRIFYCYSFYNILYECVFALTALVLFHVFCRFVFHTYGVELWTIKGI